MCQVMHNTMKYLWSSGIPCIVVNGDGINSDWHMLGLWPSVMVCSWCYMVAIIIEMERIRDDVKYIIFERIWFIF